MLTPLPAGSNTNLSVSASSPISESKGKWFRKTSASGQITIKDSSTGDISVITVKGKNIQEVQKIINSIQDAVKIGTSMKTTEDVLRCIKNKVVNTSAKNNAQNEKIANMFSKALDKRGGYTSNRQFLEGIEEHRSKVQLLDLNKVIKDLQRNPNSKEAWGRFYASMEAHNTPEGIEILHSNYDEIQDLLDKGIELARKHKVSSGQEGSIHLHTFASDVEIANQMEKTLRDVSEKLTEFDADKILKASSRVSEGAVSEAFDVSLKEPSSDPQESVQRHSRDDSNVEVFKENQEVTPEQHAVVHSETPVITEREAIQNERKAAHDEADEILRKNPRNMQASLDAITKKLKELKNREQALDAQEDRLATAAQNVHTSRNAAPEKTFDIEEATARRKAFGAKMKQLYGDKSSGA